MAYCHRRAARHFFCSRHDCPLKKAHSGNARHSFSLLRKMEFRRASRTSAHSRFVPNGVRELLMLMVAMVSYFFTPQRVFEANEFSWRPLIEVAWIFLGIFGTMIPVLDYAELHASDFHLVSDARFYWSTGLLSGVLDNAPTYLTFLTAALSLDHFDINRLPDVAEFASSHGSRLAAISVAAPFFVVLTYVGNRPNPLIRAIPESRHVPAPGFLAYISTYVLPILIPLLVMGGLIFFRG